MLFCDTDSNYLEQNSKTFEEAGGFETVGVEYWKDAEKLLESGPFDLCFINSDESYQGCLELIKYIHSKKLKTKIVVTANSLEVFENTLTSEKVAKRLGVLKTFIKPVPGENLLSFAKGELLADSPLRPLKESFEEQEAFDEQFTSINIGEFFFGNPSIFDLYVKIRKNRYLKFLKQGEIMEGDRLERYAQNEGIEKFYFKTTDRAAYINFLNSLIKKAIKKNAGSRLTKTKLVKSISHQLIEQIYTKGLDKQILKNTAEFCDNLHQTILNIKEINEHFEELSAGGDAEKNHLFLTAIYSDIIFNQVDWVSERFRKKLILASLLHDIGKLKLPKTMRFESGRKTEFRGHDIV